MSPEETAGSVKMALGMWGAVGPSNHVLDGSPDPPMVRGNFGGASSPIEKHWDCVFPSVQRHVLRYVSGRMFWKSLIEF